MKKLHKFQKLHPIKLVINKGTSCKHETSANKICSFLIKN